MNDKSKEQIQAEYADLLDEDNDEDMWRLAQRLDVQYSPGDPLSRLPGPPTREPLAAQQTPSRLGAGRLLARGRSRLSIRVRRPRSPLALAGAILAVLLLSVGVVVAASGILDLGTPTNVTSPNPHFPLSGFRHDAKLLTIGKPGGKAQVLFIGTLSQYDLYSGPERWPVVKALEEFGKLSHIQAVDHVCTPNAQANRDLCSTPTFDWSGATYRSKYVLFEHKDLFRVGGSGGISTPFQRLSKGEGKLFTRIAQVPARLKNREDPYGVFGALFKQRIPILAIGDYVQTSSQIVLIGDFQEQLQRITPAGKVATPTSGYVGTLYDSSGLSFQQVQTALATHKDPPNTSLNVDVNAEANIITALICHADGNKPGSICGRAPIKLLTRHLR